MFVTLARMEAAEIYIFECRSSSYPATPRGGILARRNWQFLRLEKKLKTYGAYIFKLVERASFDRFGPNRMKE